VTLQEFKKLVRTEFGADLRHMTPANVREFLERVQVDGAVEERRAGAFRINEPERTYEGIVRDFYARVLEMPSDEAVIHLWVYSLEMTVDSLSELEAARFEKLFAE
jgi:hypothetical protein